MRLVFGNIEDDAEAGQESNEGGTAVAEEGQWHAGQRNEVEDGADIDEHLGENPDGHPEGK